MMERTTWMKIGFEIVVILNALSIITWILLSIFPGLYYFSEGNLETGFRTIFFNLWFYLFVISLGAALFIQAYLGEEVEEGSETKSV